MSDPQSPDERHQRQLMAFCRFAVAVHDADEAVRSSIISLARSIDRGDLSRADTLANLSLLDELLMDSIEPEYRKGRDG